MSARGWLVLALVGCGGSTGGAGGGATGLAGMYMTTSHTQARPCEEAPTDAPLDDPPFFRIDDEQLANGRFFSAYPCTGAAPSTCDEHAFPLLQVGRDVGNGVILAEQVVRSQGDTGGCLITWTGHFARASDGGVTLREEVRIGDWTGPACTEELSDAQIASGRTLECRLAEVRVGKKL